MPFTLSCYSIKMGCIQTYSQGQQKSNPISQCCSILNVNTFLTIHWVKRSQREGVLTMNWSRWGISLGHKRTPRKWWIPWNSCMLKDIGNPSSNEPADTGSSATQKAMPKSWELAASSLPGSHVWGSLRARIEADGTARFHPAPWNAALAPWHQQISCSSPPSTFIIY